MTQAPSWLNAKIEPTNLTLELMQKHLWPHFKDLKGSRLLKGISFGLFDENYEPAPQVDRDEGEGI